MTTSTLPKALLAIALGFFLAGALSTGLFAQSKPKAPDKAPAKAADKEPVKGPPQAPPKMSGQGPDGTIAVVDMGKAIDASSEGKSLNGKFGAEYEKTRTRLNDKGKDLERRANEFNQNQASMSEKDRESKRVALTKELEAFDKETEKANQDFRATVEKGMLPLYQRAEKVVQDLAKKGNYLAVVENGTDNAVLFSGPGIAVVDITNEVTLGLDGKKK
ncbi:MAG: OmpH family outer membrane protein [Deltaproteobacteria bacterium]|jgi:Skp family chaperone for outer membrane proteins|nr:OmpH family outer membrane protein [Deltaproteobacteria bacterium]